MKALVLIAAILSILVLPDKSSCQPASSSSPDSSIILYDWRWTWAVSFVRDSFRVNMGKKIPSRVQVKFDEICTWTLVTLMRFKIPVPPRDVLIEGLTVCMDSLLMEESSRLERLKKRK